MWGLGQMPGLPDFIAHLLKSILLANIRQGLVRHYTLGNLVRRFQFVRSSSVLRSDSLFYVL